MSILQSNRDALLLAVPMVTLLFAGFFRLDELICKPKKPLPSRRQMIRWNKEGHPVCLDPDGTITPPRRTRP